MSDPSREFSDSLDACLVRAFALLSQAVTDRRAAMHTPVIATIGLDGSPRSRTVVLRHFDEVDRSIRFHTDIRSEKFAEIQRDSRISVTLYDASEKVQLRLNGRALLHVSDKVADDAWAATQAMSRHTYATEPAPGSEIAEGGAFMVAKGRELSEAGRPYFCVVRVLFSRLEWLWLGSDGHRRAVFELSDRDEPLTKRWLAP